eukprot:scaffold55524_cov38-Cyclotella_meneghiniana.AAC.6
MPLGIRHPALDVIVPLPPLPIGPRVPLPVVDCDAVLWRRGRLLFAAGGWIVFETIRDGALVPFPACCYCWMMIGV